MIRKYALFSQKNKKTHTSIVAFAVLITIANMFLLLSEERIIFSLGLVIPIFPLIIFAKASDYKTKYLHD